MAALDSLKARHGVARLNLVGHSGGGVIATLLAQRRNDIDTLVTVASPLALQAWVQHHLVSPLTGSLDPATSVMPVLVAKAVHFAGEKDTVVPPAVIDVFVRTQGGRMVGLADQDHECCWASAWPRLLEQLQ
jgi:pimeloyl-ACP methyl ester carboxylesterase